MPPLPPPSTALDRPFPFHGYSLLIHEYSHVNTTLHVCRGSPLRARFFNFLHEYPLYRQPGPDRGSFLSSRKRRGSLCPRPFAFPPTPPPFNHFHTRAATLVHALVHFAISLGGNAPSSSTPLDLHESGNGLTSGQRLSPHRLFSLERKKGKEREKKVVAFSLPFFLHVYIICVCMYVQYVYIYMCIPFREISLYPVTPLRSSLCCS